MINKQTAHISANDYSSLCQRCQQDEAREPHTCPFAVEINDDETLCNCCVDCEHECAMDI